MIRDNRLNRNVALLILLSLLLLTVGLQIALSPSAEARCGGVGTPQNHIIVHGSVNRGEETVQNLGTCDNDGIYLGRLKDLVTDGSCVWAEYFDPNQSTPVTACTTGVYVNYTWFDQNGNSSANYRLCYNPACTAIFGTTGY